VRQIEIKAMARRAEVCDRRDISGGQMPAALQREQRWLPRMITDGCFLQYLQVALMPISSCSTFVTILLVICLLL
jgi:hypothetical protein